MRFSKYLTPEERVSAWNSGLTYKLAEKEILPSEFNEMVKKAAGPEGLVKPILWTALLAGAPIGIAAHLMDDSVHNSGSKVRELKQRRDYFRDLSARIEQELGDEEEPEEVDTAKKYR